MIVLHFIIAFFEEFFGFVIAGAFFNRENGLKFEFPLLFSFVVAAIQLGLSVFDASAVWQISFAVAMLFLFLKFYYSENDLKTALVVIAYCFVMFISDLISYTLFTFSEGAPAARIFDKHYPNAAITIVVSRVILALICVTIYMLVRRRHSSYAQLGVVISLIVTGAVFMVFALFFTDLRQDSTFERTPLTYFFILLMLIIASIYVGIASFLKSQERRRRFELTKQQNRILERSLREQENAFALWRRSVHDYKNTVLALDAMLENGELDKLREYIDREKQSFMHRAEYIRSGNGTVDTILNTKYAVAETNNIPFTVNASMPKKCGVSDIHLASVMGNLIDNAIEASIDEDDPFIDIKIAEVQGFLMIKIVNRCSVLPQSFETTKPDKPLHGIGLQSVRDTLRYYDGQFDLTFDEGKAVASVMIPIKNH